MMYRSCCLNYSCRRLSEPTVGREGELLLEYKGWMPMAVEYRQQAVSFRPGGSSSSACVVFAAEAGASDPPPVNLFERRAS